jgi:hypothetical protein
LLALASYKKLLVKKTETNGHVTEAKAVDGKPVKV